MPLTQEGLLNGLWIAVAIMLLIILYNLLFILVDVRKISRRLETLTADMEEFVRTPIMMADSIVKTLFEMLEEWNAPDKGEKKLPSNKK